LTLAFVALSRAPFRFPVKPAWAEFSQRERSGRCFTALADTWRGLFCLSCRLAHVWRNL